MKSALIAMSGGVDSGVAAYLMKKNGYNCTGVTMKLFDNADIGISRERSCCSLDDVEDARAVAYRLGIPYYVFNFKADFDEKVIEKFVKTYENGGTPNPCIDCNRYLKFDALFGRAKQLGIDSIVTGHYARVNFDEKSGRYLLKKGRDITKDQSYVLYHLTQTQLAKTAFPLGEYEKKEIREIARRAGFENFNKKTVRIYALFRMAVMQILLKLTAVKNILKVNLFCRTERWSEHIRELFIIQSGKESGWVFPLPLRFMF